MKKVLIATHGTYAQGACDAASIIIGEREHVHTINAYTEDKVLKDEINDYFSNIKEHDVVIILTDMFGGSVNQALMQYTKKEHVYLITGFNLVLLLEVLMLDEHGVSDTHIRLLVEESKHQVMFVNDVLKQKSTDDFDM